MGQPGHEFNKNTRRCSCGWAPDLRSPLHSETQWANHLNENRPKRVEMSREAAIYLLQSIARKTGDATTPAEDVIDIAQAVLALMG